jgi:hypothetical protein
MIEHHKDDDENDGDYDLQTLFCANLILVTGPLHST